MMSGDVYRNPHTSRDNIYFGGRAEIKHQAKLAEWKERILSCRSQGIAVTVEDLSEPATLIVAEYEGNQMTAIQVMSVSGDGTYAMDELTARGGRIYKAFLTDSASAAPLCGAMPF